MSAPTRALVQTTYDALAAEYATHLSDELQGKPLDRGLLDRFADQVRGKGPVYDLGCGPGHVARYLHDRGVTVSGVDLSPAMLDEARRRHPGIVFRQGDLLALDCADGALAGAVLFYSIVHLSPETLPSAFRELRRALAPGHDGGPSKGPPYPSGGTALLAFHVGDHVVQPGELWGIPVSLSWVFFRTEDVAQSLVSAGLAITEIIERDPYEGVEHPSRRAYILATHPG